MIKQTDMTDQKVKDQDVKEPAGFNEADGYPSCEGTPCDNMADEENASTDTMAEGDAEGQNQQVEPTPEEVIAVWRDKYMRLQAEFDNYRKRTLREKMDLVASGG